MTFTPSNYPNIVYKYRTWKDQFHKDVILKNNLYLASPKDFNDPFDLRIQINYSLLDTPKKIEDYANAVVQRHSRDLQGRGIDVEAKKRDLIFNLSNKMMEVQEADNKLTVDMQDIHYGILSLSKRWDSILMWSHYADCHRGFCAGFYEEKLRSSGFFRGGGPVTCDDEYPKLDPLDEQDMKQAFSQTHYKAQEWEYEQEYRLSNLFYPNIPTTIDRTISIPDSFFAEVLLGLSMPIKDKQEVIEVCKLKNVPVHELQKVPFAFKLQKIQVA